MVVTRLMQGRRKEIQMMELLYLPVPRSLQRSKTAMENGIAALQATMENGMSPVQLETDSCCLEEAIENDSIDRARGGVFYMEVRDMVNYQFDHVEILFVPRSCNTVAHDIARYGLYWDSGQFLIWTDHLLEFVIDLEFG
jgi:hypothetical protein